MKPEEAILMMRNRIDTASEIAGKGTDGKAFEDMEMAIEALKEIQQYREIGTVEQVRNQKHNLEMAYKIISDYEAIGTVEECRKAVEKQKPKAPAVDKYHHDCCPNCGWVVAGDTGYGKEYLPHCENCGQKILWDERLEETEDE